MTLAIFPLGLAGLFLVFSTGKARNQYGIFPRDCQSDVAALRIQFPYRYLRPELVPDLEAQTRSVTNCRRFGFQFFLKTLEVTHLHYFDGAGINWERLYGLNGNGEKDLIVHVENVQPATALQDPTISTNLAVDQRHLQLARAKFDGNREPLEGHDLDRFRPFDAELNRSRIEEHRIFFLSRPGAAVEFVGMCTLTLDRSRWRWCRVLAYSQQDGFAFGVILPHAELGQINDIIDRSLWLIRKWRVPA